MTNLSDRKLKREGGKTVGRNRGEGNRGSFGPFILFGVSLFENSHPGLLSIIKYDKYQAPRRNLEEE